jgi:CubicO group peptidase (beta-lactamase class C family)
LVLNQDKPIFSSYTRGYGPNKVSPIFSGTKGFWCVTAAIAAQNKIIDFDEPVQNTIVEWKSDPDKKEIQIRDLLNFTAGIDPEFKLHGKSIKDRNRYSVHLRSTTPPGKSFMYGPSQLQIFGELLKRKLARRHETPESFITKHLLVPLGIGSVDFREDDKGNPLLASGFKFSADQWARLGELIMNDGKYHRRQWVQPSYLNQLFRGTRSNPMFGMGFWLNGGATDPEAQVVDVEDMLELPWYRQQWRGVCLSHYAPSDMLVGIGSEYQRLYIIPSMDLIIVRQGRYSRFSDDHFLRLIFSKQD